MWGEIEPPVKTQQSAREGEDESKLPEEPVTQRLQRCDFYRPADTQQPRQDTQVRPAASAALLYIRVMQISAHCALLLLIQLLLFLRITQYVSQAETSCVNDMIEAIAMSGSPVKSQQIGEAELTLKERREELLHQYRSRPLVFLERYHVCVHSSVWVFEKGWWGIKTYNQSTIIK